jgi:hypothetical protein
VTAWLADSLSRSDRSRERERTQKINALTLCHSATPLCVDQNIKSQLARKNSAQIRMQILQLRHPNKKNKRFIIAHTSRGGSLNKSARFLNTLLNAGF